MITTNATFKPSIKNRIEGLDELRGIAILFVMIDHGNLIFSNNFNAELLVLGYSGVDLFFMISGYLISYILIRSVNDSNYFRKFYIRRIFRIWPLSFLFILIGIFLAIKAHDTVNLWHVLPFYLTFTQNYIVPFHIGNTLPGVPHFWSLAIEEQFYLLLPLVFYFIPAKKWGVAILIISIFSLLGRYIFAYTEKESLMYYYTNLKQTYLRLYCLGIGILMALPNAKRNLGIFFAFWALCVIFIGTNNGILELPTICIYSLFIWMAVSGKPVIRSKFLTNLGKLCFGLYIVHFSLVRIISSFSINKSLGMQLFYFAIYGVISYLLAVISFRYFETPIQNLRSKYEK